MTDEKYKIKIRKWLAEIEGDLADDARDLLKESKVYCKDADMKESQINNLIQHSEETKSFEAVKSLIRYQISRSKNGKQWDFAVNVENSSQPFGEFLISKLDEFYNKEYYPEMGKLVKDTGYEESEIFWNLMQLYFGYIKWYFVYEKGRIT
ncbi:MAG: hypothetical protein QG641_55 [Candidatus Poribacteria bacterium]|nr:hypothetical protein [Candidatus Poribacteria bacterium]